MPPVWKTVDRRMACVSCRKTRCFCQSIPFSPVLAILLNGTGGPQICRRGPSEFRTAFHVHPVELAEVMVVERVEQPSDAPFWEPGL